MECKIRNMLPRLWRLCGYFKKNFGTELITGDEITKS
jgi:hypothetical protein